MQANKSQFIRLDYAILCYKKLHVWERVVLAFLIGLGANGRVFYGDLGYFEEAGLSKADLFRILTKLQELGFIYKDSENAWHCNDINTIYDELLGG